MLTFRLVVLSDSLQMPLGKGDIQVMADEGGPRLEKTPMNSVNLPKHPREFFLHVWQLHMSERIHSSKNSDFLIYALFKELFRCWEGSGMPA